MSLAQDVREALYDVFLTAKGRKKVKPRSIQSYKLSFSRGKEVDRPLTEEEKKTRLSKSKSAWMFAVGMFGKKKNKGG